MERPRHVKDSINFIVVSEFFFKMGPVQCRWPCSVAETWFTISLKTLNWDFGRISWFFDRVRLQDAEFTNFSWGTKPQRLTKRNSSGLAPIRRALIVGWTYAERILKVRHHELKFCKAWPYIWRPRGEPFEYEFGIRNIPSCLQESAICDKWYHDPFWQRIIVKTCQVEVQKLSFQPRAGPNL